VLIHTHGFVHVAINCSGQQCTTIRKCSVLHGRVQITKGRFEECGVSKSVIAKTCRRMSKGLMLNSVFGGVQPIFINECKTICEWACEQGGEGPCGHNWTTLWKHQVNDLLLLLERCQKGWGAWQFLPPGCRAGNGSMHTGVVYFTGSRSVVSIQFQRNKYPP
jgi:hypothetical protein